MVIVDPTEPLAVIVPSAAPKQLTFVALADTVTVIGSVIVTLVVAVHTPLLFPFGAVAVISYVPGPYDAAGADPLMVIVDPSEPLAVIVPLAKPLQLTFVALADTVTVIGSVIVTLVVAVHTPLLFPFGAVATTV